MMYDLIVVGGGPAGLTAALYAARAGKSALVLERESLGGQISYSPLVENYPAIPHVSGADLAAQLSAQVEALGVTIDFAAVLAVQPQERGFVLETDMGQYHCAALVLATGVHHRALGLPGEADLVGAGVSYCAVCDGAFFAGREVAIVGGGDTALQEALFLSNSCTKVTVIHRRDAFRAQARLVQQLTARENVQILFCSTVTELLQEDGILTGIVLRSTETDAETTLSVDGLFIAAGQVPDNAAFSALVQLDDAGYIIAGEDTCTSLPGVFAAGDCRKKQVRQLTTAVGDGAVAGLAACSYIDATA